MSTVVLGDLLVAPTADADALEAGAGLVTADTANVFVVGHSPAQSRMPSRLSIAH